MTPLPTLRYRLRAAALAAAVGAAQGAAAQSPTCDCGDIHDLQARYCSSFGAIQEWERLIKRSWLQTELPSGADEKFTLTKKQAASDCVDDVITMYQNTFTGNTNNKISTHKAGAETNPMTCKVENNAPTACLREVLDKHEKVHVATCEAARAPGATPQRDYGFILNLVARSTDWRLTSSMSSFMVEEISAYGNELTDIQQKLMDLAGRCPKGFFEKPDGKGGMKFSLTPCPRPNRDPAGWSNLKCKLWP
jgi:hypothetical protein